MNGVMPPVRAVQQSIQSYGNGVFWISGERHSGSVIVLPKVTISWAVDRYEDISSGSIQSVPTDETDIEILLIGCGKRMGIPRDDVRNYLREFGIISEWMDTGAACRTFNVLLGEDRRVAAALMLVD